MDINFKDLKLTENQREKFLEMKTELNKINMDIIITTKDKKDGFDIIFKNSTLKNEIDVLTFDELIYAYELSILEYNYHKNLKGAL